MRDEILKIPETRWDGYWECFRRTLSCWHSCRLLSVPYESTTTRSGIQEGKRHTSYKSSSTNVYIQKHWSTALKLLGKTAQTKIVLPPVTTWTLYNYTCLEVNVTYGAKYRWYNGAQNKNQWPPKSWNTVTETHHNLPKKMQYNCVWASLAQLTT